MVFVQLKEHHAHRCDRHASVAGRYDDFTASVVGMEEVPELQGERVGFGAFLFCDMQGRSEVQKSRHAKKEKKKEEEEGTHARRETKNWV
jgi:hypothetical protein